MFSATSNTLNTPSSRVPIRRDTHVTLHARSVSTPYARIANSQVIYSTAAPRKHHERAYSTSQVNTKATGELPLKERDGKVAPRERRPFRWHTAPKPPGENARGRRKLRRAMEMQLGLGKWSIASDNGEGNNSLADDARGHSPNHSCSSLSDMSLESDPEQGPGAVLPASKDGNERDEASTSAPSSVTPTGSARRASLLSATAPVFTPRKIVHQPRHSAATTADLSLSSSVSSSAASSISGSPPTASTWFNSSTSTKSWAQARTQESRQRYLNYMDEKVARWNETDNVLIVHADERSGLGYRRASCHGLFDDKHLFETHAEASLPRHGLTHLFTSDKRSGSSSLLQLPGTKPRDIPPMHFSFDEHVSPAPTFTSSYLDRRASSASPPLPALPTSISRVSTPPTTIDSLSKLPAIPHQPEILREELLQDALNFAKGQSIWTVTTGDHDSWTHLHQRRASLAVF